MGTENAANINTEKKESVNACLGAYSSLAVISALLFGFSQSLCSSAVSENLKDVSRAPFYTFVVLSSVATSSTMLATVIFTYQLYFGIRLVAENKPEEADDFLICTHVHRNIGRVSILLGLVTMVCSLIAQAWLNIGGTAAALVTAIFTFAVIIALATRQIQSNMHLKRKHA